MSIIKAIKQQLGLSVTPANNFTLDASADNGTMKLARNSGQDIMTVDAAGKATFALLGGFDANLTTNGYQKLPSGLIIQWGTAQTDSSGIASITFQIPFPAACCSRQGNAISLTPFFCQPYSHDSTYVNFKVMTQAGASAGAGQYVVWIAIGY